MFKIPEKCFECENLLTKETINYDHKYGISPKTFYSCESHIWIYASDCEWERIFSEKMYDLKILCNGKILEIGKNHTNLWSSGDIIKIPYSIQIDPSSKQDIENKINMLLTFS